MPKYLFLLLVLVACSGGHHEKKTSASAAKEQKRDSVAVAGKPEIPVNDTLTTISGLIAGNVDHSDLFAAVTDNSDYQSFRENFSKRWKTFDSTRIKKLSDFRTVHLDKDVTPHKTLFYPFSGPDILHAQLFFPEAEQYVLVGLEPVGTLPRFSSGKPDSLKEYYHTINTSLNAILNFSFFRTESMHDDLRNNEVNGTLHLLFLFLSRTGNTIVSATPITVDSAGHTQTLASFEAMREARLKTKGVRIQFKTKNNDLKELLYFSVNAADYNLQSNPGFVSYLKSFQSFDVYLKGASYLLHKSTFSMLRGILLNGANAIVQDDSGIALKYFESGKWKFRLYGHYSKPIQMFAKHYQPLLDSMYHQQGSTQLDFGLGYNYRDKNSNFMVIIKEPQ